MYLLSSCVSSFFSCVGVLPEKASIFKSAMAPLGIVFQTSEGLPYRIIFKTGDDLRQDQLIIQLISLMNNLLLRENIDLKLTPYAVLANRYAVQ
jgi:phosphatidylinositol 3-kinase